MKQTLSISAILGAVLAAACAQAAELPGISFFHKDWELACDNTRTCRAAGYQSGDGDMAVSLLLTRAAGPNQPVTAQLMLGGYDTEAMAALPPDNELVMRINGRPAGKVKLAPGAASADLNASQVAALLAALTRRSTIEWSAGAHTWRLSDEGAAAVLLKMDEFQGRLGTVGALIKKGKRGEEGVLPPLPVPVLTIPRLDPPRPGDSELATAKAQALREALGVEPGEEREGSGITVTRLTGNKLLVSAGCWLAAYNAGCGYWVINDKPPYRPQLVTETGGEFSGGRITSSMKGRGLGDCWSSDEWAWNGRRFVHTQSSSTGMCRLVAAGGAWSLPVIVTDVRESK